MRKTLNVITPFFTAELGDKFTLTEDEKFYSLDKNEEFHKLGDDSGEVQSSFYSTFKISPDYANSLIKEGYLAKDENDVQEKPFVNVFDEIDNLISEYTKEIAHIETDMKDQPRCVKVEKETVLHNLVKVLNYLKDLKK